MGFFVNNHEEYNTYVRENGSRRANCQNVYPSDMFVKSCIVGGVSIFGTLLNKIGEGKGGSNNVDDVDDGSSDDTQEKIDAINEEINNILKDAKLSSADGFTTAINEIDNKQDKLTDEINDCKTSIGIHETQIIRLTNEINTLKEKDPNGNQNLIASYEKQINKTKTLIDNINKEQKDKETELKTEQMRKNELLVQKGQVENLQQRIKELKGEQVAEAKYDIEQERNDIAAFKNALKQFKDKPSQETAAALSSACNGSSKVDNKTVRSAYDFIKKQYPQFFWK